MQFFKVTAQDHALCRHIHYRKDPYSIGFRACFGICFSEVFRVVGFGLGLFGLRLPDFWLRALEFKV